MVSEAFVLPEVAARLLGDTGDVQLSSLTREELRAVGDDPLLANAADTLWWDGLTERERELVLETAQRSLLARNLLAPDVDGEILPAEEVRLVLAARGAPDWVAVLGEPGAERDSDGAPVQVALLALPSGTSTPSPGVLVSARVEGVYLHRLVASATAYDVAADWLLRPGPDDEADETEVGRTLELLAPVGEQLRAVRGLVVGRGGARFLSEVGDEGPGEPTPVDAAALSGWIRGLLAPG